MNIKQITDSLTKIYQEENKRIIFWYDTDGEFEEVLFSLDLTGGSIIRLDEMPSLKKEKGTDLFFFPGTTRSAQFYATTDHF